MRFLEGQAESVRQGAQAVRHDAHRSDNARVLQGVGERTRCAVSDSQVSLPSRMRDARASGRHDLATIAGSQVCSSALTGRETWLSDERSR